VFTTTCRNMVNERKSIAIVGAGSGGLAMMKTLLDTPEHTSWHIVVFEERENVGGIWWVPPVIL
jgi:cation diffusion facilitator CzcD-associated flavoprotein CzcO